ncbi:MAG: hypothetical protein KBE27_04635 [Syntrophorhabdaceae bacterium]|nr:hypothetical protein [Syntrophorhabdaceae bacterium]
MVASTMALLRLFYYDLLLLKLTVYILYIKELKDKGGGKTVQRSWYVITEFSTCSAQTRY